ncbi:MAG: hypothetical protein AMJ62_15830 [Myxococcales bacterium SG8_38]|nr:MAG: hypothetical protein AMJ62_15830 [Myxococcales bacterium SG8_38]
MLGVRVSISQTDEKGMETMALAKDPVCGMTVDPDLVHTQKSEYESKTYYFCSPGCKEAFDKEPDKYVSPSEAG